ncbi:MAG: DNA-processing protein DprA [Candidatus Accumulibacter sp.]|jgi:predicted Rossmann fold nucleotide-binding protein DprA/Smf involved in DNA uptake|nr:DNA-processing protein DprA [Accumulibacter sp.]
MTPTLSLDTQAILLLTAPLIAGRSHPAPDFLTPGEYKRLARHLREIQRQPADLVSPDAGELLRACRLVIDQTRLERLLGRGFLLSQVIERWQARAIWVLSRADDAYPRRLKARLRENAPALLYGCGDIGLLESGGLAVVGSRQVGEALIDYTMSVGKLAASAGRTLVSGGASGVDQAAMRGALEAGGSACGILADSLEKTTLTREYRNLLLDGRLTLISPYDPNAGFSAGNAMQRNKLIYALADASLVINSDVGKGGTWAGAVEQLDKFGFVPVYVRSTGEPSAGIDALRKKGALSWPNPNDADSFEAVFNAPPPSLFDRAEFTLNLEGGGRIESKSSAPPSPESAALPRRDVAPADVVVDGQRDPMRETRLVSPTESLPRPAQRVMENSPAEALFAVVREAIERLLTTPMKNAEVAAALEVSVAQAKDWLQRLADEGVLEKRDKSASYVVKQKRLFE